MAARLIKLTNAEGGTVLINTAAIEWIEPDGDGTKMITRGAVHEFGMPVDSVARLVAGEADEGGGKTTVPRRLAVGQCWKPRHGERNEVVITGIADDSVDGRRVGYRDLPGRGDCVGGGNCTEADFRRSYPDFVPDLSADADAPPADASISASPIPLAPGQTWGDGRGEDEATVERVEGGEVLYRRSRGGGGGHGTPSVSRVPSFRRLFPRFVSGPRDATPPAADDPAPLPALSPGQVWRHPLADGGIDARVVAVEAGRVDFERIGREGANRLGNRPVDEFRAYFTALVPPAMHRDDARAALVVGTRLRVVRGPGVRGLGGRFAGEMEAFVAEASAAGYRRGILTSPAGSVLAWGADDPVRAANNLLNLIADLGYVAVGAQGDGEGDRR